MWLEGVVEISFNGRGAYPAPPFLCTMYTTSPISRAAFTSVIHMFHCPASLPPLRPPPPPLLPASWFLVRWACCTMPFLFVDIFCLSSVSPMCLLVSGAIIFCYVLLPSLLFLLHCIFFFEAPCVVCLLPSGASWVLGTVFSITMMRSSSI